VWAAFLTTEDEDRMKAVISEELAPLCPRDESYLFTLRSLYP